MQENRMLRAVLNLEKAAAQAHHAEMMALAAYIKETALDFYLDFSSRDVSGKVQEDMVLQSRAVLEEITKETLPHALPRRLRRIFFSLFETEYDETMGGNPEAVRRVLIRCRDSLRAAENSRAYFESAARLLPCEGSETELEAFENQLTQLRRNFDNLLLLYRSSIHVQLVRRKCEVLCAADDGIPSVREIDHENERRKMAQEKWTEKLENFLTFSAENG